MGFRGSLRKLRSGATLRVHSQPGEFPRKQTGHLRRNINYEMSASGLVARVGTNVKYGKFLELGTSKMAKRPWLVKTLMQERAVIARLMGRGR